MRGGRGRDLPPPVGGRDGTHADALTGAGDVNFPATPGTLAYAVERLRDTSRAFGSAVLDALWPRRVRARVVAEQARMTAGYTPGSLILWPAWRDVPRGWQAAPWPWDKPGSPMPGTLPLRYIIRDGWTPCRCDDQPEHVWKSTLTCHPFHPWQVRDG